jgi:hypothetical protein
VAVTATYCHVVEHVVTNIAPILIGPLMARAHWDVFMGWLASGFQLYVRTQRIQLEMAAGGET